MDFNLLSQDLSRYMSAYNPQSINHPMNQQKNKSNEDTMKNNEVAPRQIVYISSEFSTKQLDDL